MKKDRMRQPIFSVLACLLTIIQLSAQAQQRVNLVQALFNSNWQYVKDPDTNIRDILFKKTGLQVDWEKVSLPHTTNIEPVVKVNQQWQGNSYYRKFFILSPSDANRHLTIRLDAAMNDADIYLNGKFLLNHKGGYLPFEIDINKAAFYGKENCLLVRLNNKDNEEIPPGKAIKDIDFNFYGGLYRNAWIIKKMK
jgi:beta-galactosidase